MTDPSAWCRSPDVLSRRSLDAWLVMAPGGAGPATLTGTGAELWDLIAEPKALSELVDRFAEHYAATGSEVRDDLVATLDDLMTKGLVRQRR